MTTMTVKDFNVVLLDIEGTTTSISFVHDVLFPYARNRLENFLTNNWNDSEIVQIVGQIKSQYDTDLANGFPGLPSVPVGSGTLSTVVTNLLWQMDLDRKSTGLKALQGIIWKKGYETGEIISHIFPDVQPALERWSSTKKVYIYSSGSVGAQKLLFGHTEFGDLTKHLSGYFDTTTGPKVEAESYSKIASNITELPENILFFTDNLQEADAALDAGFQAVVTIRPGNPDVSIDPTKYMTVTNFDWIN